MLESLNTNTQLAKVSAELVTGLQRLQSLMQIGESRQAQVVAVVAQVPRSAPPSSAREATRSQRSESASTDSRRTTATEHRSGTSQQSLSATTQYRIQVQIQGQRVELLTRSPLAVGSEITLSRGEGRQIQIQVPNHPNAHSTAQSTVTTNNATPDQSASSTAKMLELLPRANQQVSARVITSEPIPSTSSLNTPAPNAPSTTAPPPTAPNAPSTTAPPPTAQNTPSTTAPLPTAQNTPSTTAPLPTAPNAPSTTAPPPTATNAQLMHRRTGAEAMRLLKELGVSSPAPATPANLPTNKAEGSNGYRIQVELNGRILELQTPRPLPTGTEVRLSRDNTGQVTLHLPSERQLAVAEAQRHNLPRQQPPDELLNLVQTLTNNATLRQSQPILMSLVTLLLGRSLGSPQKADAEQVKKRVQNGGTLMESRVARGETQQLGQDQKALLMKISQQLSQASTTRDIPAQLSERLSQLTQQSISRVITNQIHSLTAGQRDGEGEPPRALVVDLPIQTAQGKHENIQLQIREQAARERDKPPELRRWQIDMRFRIAGLPPMEATLTLERDEASLIWRGERGTRALINPHLSELSDRFLRQGLNLGVVGVREGVPARHGRNQSMIDLEG